MAVDERLEVKRDPNYRALPMDSSDIVEPNYAQYQPPSEGSRRCMIYRFVGDTVQESLRTVDDNNGTTGRKA